MEADMAQGYLEQWLNSLDMTGIDEGMANFFPQLHINGEQLLSMILQGKAGDALLLLTEQVKGNFLAELSGLKEVLLYILILGIVSALFAEFSDLFAGQQMAQVGFYFLYLLLTVLLTKVFLFVSQTASAAISSILLFMKLFVPTYFVVAGTTQGASAAAYYYYLMLLSAYLIESVLSAVLIPFIYSYVLLALLNGLWPEEKLALLLDFMQKGILLTLKLLMGGMMGLSMVQALILPAVEGLKLSAFRKTLSSLPGIGNMAEGVTELVIGSAVLIKNSMGVLLMLLLLAVCLLPLFQITAVAGVVKLGAAVTGIVSDKRLSGAVYRVGDGCFMLLKCVFTSMAMFLVVIAVVAYTLSG